MTTSIPPNLGGIAYPDALRDAVHIAVLPVTCSLPVGAGARIRVEGDRAIPKLDASMQGLECNAVADPWFRVTGGGACIPSGVTFWALMDPGTIKGLRHHWSHPDVPDEGPEAEPASLSEEPTLVDIQKVAEERGFTTHMMRGSPYEYDELALTKILARDWDKKLARFWLLGIMELQDTELTTAENTEKLDRLIDMALEGREKGGVFVRQGSGDEPNALGKVDFDFDHRMYDPEEQRMFWRCVQILRDLPIEDVTEKPPFECCI